MPVAAIEAEARQVSSRRFGPPIPSRSPIADAVMTCTRCRRSSAACDRPLAERATGLGPAIDDDREAQKRDPEADLEQPLERRIGLRPVRRRRGSDRNESRARDELAQDHAEPESERLQPSGAHHRERRGKAQRAQRGDEGIRDQVSGCAGHDCARLSRRLMPGASSPTRDDSHRGRCGAGVERSTHGGLLLRVSRACRCGALAFAISAAPAAADSTYAPIEPSVRPPSRFARPSHAPRR